MADLASAVPSAEPVVAKPSGLAKAKLSWLTVGGVKHHALVCIRKHVCPPIRLARSRGRAGWVDHLPLVLRRRFELDGDRIEPLKVEMGGGQFPSPGYVHVDADPMALHVEHLATASRLPFSDGTVEELLAIHVLEHVHASALLPTLKEWRRVLRPGGFAQVHVPDAAAVFAAFLDSPPERKWTIMVPIFGKTSHARHGEPEAADLERHHAIYDFALLERVLLDAGFDRVEDVSSQVTDRHTQAWSADDLMDRMSLVVRAHIGHPGAGAAP